MPRRTEEDQQEPHSTRSGGSNRGTETSPKAGWVDNETISWLESLSEPTRHVRVGQDNPSLAVIQGFFADSAVEDSGGGNGYPDGLIFSLTSVPKVNSILWNEGGQSSPAALALKRIQIRRPAYRRRIP